MADILGALRAGGSPRHRPAGRRPPTGVAVLKEVQVRLDRDVAAGAVHATLDRLENKGLVGSRLGSGTPIRSGRPRRFYRLRPRGFRALNETRAAVESLWRGLHWPLGEST